MLERFTTCWDYITLFCVTCFYCPLGTLFNRELIHLNSLRVFFCPGAKHNCQNTPERSPGKIHRCLQVFSKLQFLSVYFLSNLRFWVRCSWWAFGLQLWAKHAHCTTNATSGQPMPYRWKWLILVHWKFLREKSKLGEANYLFINNNITIYRQCIHSL